MNEQDTDIEETQETCAGKTENNWQPIETAPKEARQLLVARIIENEIYWACTARWSTRYRCWFDGIEPGGLANPTHWMLPPRP